MTTRSKPRAGGEDQRAQPRARAASGSDAGYEFLCDGGVKLYGGACALLGLIGLARGDFTPVWHPMPEEVPARAGMAFLSAGLFLIGGVGLQVSSIRRPAGWLLSAVFLVFVITWGARVLVAPQMIGTWLGAAEQLYLVLAGLVVALERSAMGERALVAARVAFGFCELIFGLSHFLSLPETVAMTPAWIPGGRLAWALATGGFHLAAGLALVCGVSAVLASRLLALMFVGFGALVWAPQVVAAPQAWLGWCGSVINAALVGAILILGDALARQDRLRPPRDDDPEPQGGRYSSSSFDIAASSPPAGAMRRSACGTARRWPRRPRRHA